MAPSVPVVPNYIRINGVLYDVIEPEEAPGGWFYPPPCEVFHLRRKDAERCPECGEPLYGPVPRFKDVGEFRMVGWHVMACKCGYERRLG